ncbi:MAG: hypothetical protein ACK56I_34270, partial [bacterium]
RQAHIARIQSEQSIKTFGLTTARFVEVFRGENGHTTAGDVDSQTAALLNALLTSWGPPMAPGNPTEFLFSGVILLDDGRPGEGLVLCLVSTRFGGLKQVVLQCQTDVNG